MRISIITVVRNSAATIENCLLSVSGQTVPAEHIVVDGQSTDGTLELLAQAQIRNPQLQVISEPDKGMYDAMRKGIERASGDVIGCLNADDFYANTRVLERISGLFADPEVHTCYGDLVYIRGPGRDGPRVKVRQVDSQFRLPGENIVRRWRAGVMSPQAFYWGWMPPHPTFFVRRNVYQEHGLFRLDLGTAADYELMLRFLVKHRVTTRYIPEVLVKMLVGGVSNASFRNRLRANRYDRKAWTVNGLKPYPWTLVLKPVRKVGQWSNESIRQLACRAMGL